MYLTQVSPTGPKGRITKDELLSFLKGPAQAPAQPAAAPQGAGIPEVPAQDYARFGPVETVELSRIKEGLWAVPAPLVAQRPARHAQRRGGHHRAGRVPQAVGHGGQGQQGPVPGDAAGVPGQVGGRGAEGVRRVQQLADRGEGRRRPQALLPHRRRGRHAGRAGRPRGPRRRPQWHRGALPGVHGDLRQGPRGQARPERDAGRDVHDLQPRRDLGHQLHPDRTAATLATEIGAHGTDVDLFEINEAFAAVAPQSMRNLGVDDTTVNVNGGAISMGHPIGASGARIALHLALELGRRGGGLGAAGLCGGGAQGEALLLRVLA